MHEDTVLCSQMQPYVAVCGSMMAKQCGGNGNAGDAAMMALANGVLTWHRNNVFAGRDGAPMRIAEAGYSR